MIYISYDNIYYLLAIAIYLDLINVTFIKSITFMNHHFDV